MAKTKITLVFPPFGLEEITGETKSMKAVMNIIQPLGLAYIAAVLEDAGHDVKIIDCSLGKTLKGLIREVKQQKPDIVGITSTTPVFEIALRTAKSIKKELPDTLIALGGPHVTALPRQLMHDCFDVGVIGEAEYTFLELVKEFEKNGLKNKRKITGIAFREGKKVRVNKRRPFIQKLDEIPFPARHLLPPLRKYHPTPASYKRLPQAHLMTTRGCPSLCTFCDRSIFGCSYRERSAENVLDELDEVVYEYGARDIKFFDDTFTLNSKRLFEICDGIKERGFEFEWCCLTKVNCVTKEMLKKMKEAGCWQVLYGLESGDERMLAALKKGTTVEQNEKAVKWAHEVGLSVRADFIMGTPGETMESMERTMQFAMRMNMDFAHFNKFTPYPGTELYERLTKQGYKFDFSKSCSQLDHSYIMYVPDGMNREEYRKFIDNSYKRYYLRPRYLLKQLMQIRSLQDIRRMQDGFFAIYNL